MQIILLGRDRDPSADAHLVREVEAEDPNRPCIVVDDVDCGADNFLKDNDFFAGARASTGRTYARSWEQTSCVSFHAAMAELQPGQRQFEPDLRGTRVRGDRPGSGVEKRLSRRRGAEYHVAGQHRGIGYSRIGEIFGSSSRARFWRILQP